MPQIAGIGEDVANSNTVDWGRRFAEAFGDAAAETLVERAAPYIERGAERAFSNQGMQRGVINKFSELTAKNAFTIAAIFGAVLIFGGGIYLLAKSGK